MHQKTRRACEDRNNRCTPSELGNIGCSIAMVRQVNILAVYETIKFVDNFNSIVCLG